MAAAGVTSVGSRRRVRTLNDISSEELRRLKDISVSETDKMLIVLNNAKLRGHFRVYLQESMAVENLDVSTIGLYTYFASLPQTKIYFDMSLTISLCSSG
jgi:hypothetical protein